MGSGRYSVMKKRIKKGKKKGLTRGVEGWYSSQAVSEAGACGGSKTPAKLKKVKKRA